MEAKHQLRSLSKNQLGGVIFGCTTKTMRECMTKQIFGLPFQHLSYVQSIIPGLPLFLFNYSDRKLYGIFEAASSGQLNIDPYGWTHKGQKRTPFPAQVQVCLRLKCLPLTDEQYKPIIAASYFNPRRFWFELDNVQANKLISRLTSSVVTSIVPMADHKTDSDTTVVSRGNGGKLTLESHSEAKVAGKNEVDIMINELEKLSFKLEREDLILTDNGSCTSTISEITVGRDAVGEQPDIDARSKVSSHVSSIDPIVISQLMEDLEELKSYKTEQGSKLLYLERRLVESRREIARLRERCSSLESPRNTSFEGTDETMSLPGDETWINPSESILLLGGYDGAIWLSQLDAYSPDQDVIKSYSPMKSPRSFASVAQLKEKIFIFGGYDGGSLWYDAVESYDPASDEWTSCFPLNSKKGNLGGAVVNDNIFAIGGGDGIAIFSAVEMLDLDAGMWIKTRSMREKRFGLAAVQLHGSIYATGGYDGNDYLRSAERFDPREISWRRIAAMDSRRGCHSLVVLNEKLYALGGYDGEDMVSSVEMYDPRKGTWMSVDSMHRARGYAAAAVLKNSIYVMGGQTLRDGILGNVEVFEEGRGWRDLSTEVIGRRCDFCAITI